MQTMTTYSESNVTPSGISRSWLERVRVQPDPSLPKSTRYGLRQRNHGQYLISDSHEMDGTTSWWTEKPSECQVYYDLENAFRCAAILASITDKDIEVVALDR